MSRWYPIAQACLAVALSVACSGGGGATLTGGTGGTTGSSAASTTSGAGSTTASGASTTTTGGTVNGSSTGSTVTGTSGGMASTSGTTTSTVGSSTGSGTAGTASTTGTSTGTSGSGTTTAGTSGGATTGSGPDCNDGGFPELSSCQVDSDCDCPNGCVNDTGVGQMLCEQSGCTQSTDCPDPLTFCSGGTCIVNFCVADFPGDPAPGTLGAVCDSQDAGSGTCIPAGSNFLGTQSGFCVQGGSVASGGACVPFQNFPLPNQPDQLCAVGGFCIPLNDGGGQCFDVGDQGCIANLGAATGVPNTELVNCGSNLSCQCPSLCVADQAIGSNFCESTCTSDTDCPLALESCQTGISTCSVTFCSEDFLGNSLPGTLNGGCGPGDAGTCISTIGSLAGFCVLAGTGAAHDTCDFTLNKGDDSLLCGLGLLCSMGTADGGAVCQALCDPTADAGPCGTNETCTDYTGGVSTTVGVCCLSVGATCTDNQACCDGSCAFDGTCN